MNLRTKLELSAFAIFVVISNYWLLSDLSMNELFFWPYRSNAGMEFPSFVIVVPCWLGINYVFLLQAKRIIKKPSGNNQK